MKCICWFPVHSLLTLPIHSSCAAELQFGNCCGWVSASVYPALCRLPVAPLAQAQSPGGPLVPVASSCLEHSIQEVCFF